MTSERLLNTQSRPKILIVDDDPAIRRLLRAVLQRDYTVEEASTGDEALGILPAFAPDLVLLDIAMPGIDGYETCRRLKAVAVNASLQVIMVSAKSSKQEQLQAYAAGADDYVIKPFDPQDLLARVQLHIQLRDALARVTAISTEIDSKTSELKRIAEQQAQDIIAVQDVAVFTLAKLAESRDQGAAGHLTRIRVYAQTIAEHLAADSPYAKQIDRRFLDDLYRASPLHDIGKVGIPDDILLKPGRLTREEFAIMQRHTVIGADILDQAVAQTNGGGFLAMAAMVARFHHERYDGTGYPTALAGQKIPLPARIVALADAYDAITSERPYKPAYSPVRARELIQLDCGWHFDPLVVAAFEASFPAFLTIQQQYTTDDFPTVQFSASDYAQPSAASTS
jgi:putative two-component system response regulator